MQRGSFPPPQCHWNFPSRARIIPHEDPSPGSAGAKILQEPHDLTACDPQVLAWVPRLHQPWANSGEHGMVLARWGGTEMLEGTRREAGVPRNQGGLLVEEGHEGPPLPDWKYKQPGWKRTYRPEESLQHCGL